MVFCSDFRGVCSNLISSMEKQKTPSMELKPSRLGGLLQVFAQESRVVFPVAVAVAVLLLPGPASRWTSPRITSSAFCHETLWLDLPRFRGFCRENQEDEVFPIPFVWLLKKRGKTLGSLFEVVKTHLYVHICIYIYTQLVCFSVDKKNRLRPPQISVDTYLIVTVVGSLVLWANNTGVFPPSLVLVAWHVGVHTLAIYY